MTCPLLECDVVEAGEIFRVHGGYVVRVGIEAERRTRRNSPSRWYHWRAYRHDGTPVGRHYRHDGRVTGKWHNTRKAAEASLVEVAP